MRTYSEDLRERIISKRKDGWSADEVAKTFGVSKRSVERYWKQLAESGTLTPKQRGGYRRSRLAEHDACLQAWIKNDRSITLSEIRERLRDQEGIEVGTTALWHRLNRLNLTFKKNSTRRGARAS